MASVGQRPVGTDGMDYASREIVVPRYTVIAINKPRYRFMNALHMMLALLMLAKLLNDILEKCGVLWPDLAELALPDPNLWEYVWLTSVVFAFIGNAALRRNSSMLFTVAMGGIVAVGILPLFVGIFGHFSDFYHFVQTRSSKIMFRNKYYDLPVSVLNYLVIFVALQVHFATLYFGKRLLNAWNRGVAKKKKM